MGDLGFQELLLVWVVFGLLLIPVIFFMITLQNTLKAVEPQNRTMQPGQVWLLFIPLFNIVWLFIVISAIANSAKAQLEQYGVYSSEKPTYNIGLAWAICWICNWIPVIGILGGMAAIILFIVYWIKVNEVRKQLLQLRELYQNKEEGSIF